MTKRDVLQKAPYPGRPLRYVVAFPLIFRPNPLPTNVKIQYKSNVG